MVNPQNATQEIRQLARYQVRPESLDKCLTAIHEFVAYVRLNEPGTLRYEVWQELADPTSLRPHLHLPRRGSGPSPFRVGCGKEILRDTLSRVPGSRGVYRLPVRGLEHLNRNIYYVIVRSSFTAPNKSNSLILYNSCPTT